MNRDWVLFNLREAEEQLRRSISELQSKQDYDVGELRVAMEHAYHHLNTAWNSRNATAAEAEECLEEDFYRWRKFPTDDIYLGRP